MQPTHGGLDRLVPPRSLTKAARKEWERIRGDLERRRCIRQCDKALLAIFCELLAEAQTSRSRHVLGEVRYYAKMFGLGPANRDPADDQQEGDDELLRLVS